MVGRIVALSPFNNKFVKKSRQRFAIRKYIFAGAFDSAKNHKRQRGKRQSVTAKREKSQPQSSYRLGQVRLGKVGGIR